MDSDAQWLCTVGLTHLNVTNLSLIFWNFLSLSNDGSSNTAASTHTTIFFSWKTIKQNENVNNDEWIWRLAVELAFAFNCKLTWINHSTSCTNGGNTNWSRTFFITNTANGGLYHVNRWLAGSWICLLNKRWFIIIRTTVVASRPGNTTGNGLLLLHSLQFKCSVDLHNHSGIFHNTSTWSKLLERRWGIQTSGSPVIEQKQKKFKLVTDFNHYFYFYFFLTISLSMQMQNEYKFATNKNKNKNLRTRSEGSTLAILRAWTSTTPPMLIFAW